MFRTDGDSNVANKFDEGDPGVPRAPTQITAEWLNHVQEEICNVVESIGITLDKTKRDQLLTALRDSRWHFDKGLTINGIAAADALLVDGTGTSSAAVLECLGTGYALVLQAQTAAPVRAALRIRPQDAAPSSPQEGDVYFNSVTHKLYAYDGTIWQACW